MTKETKQNPIRNTLEKIVINAGIGRVSSQQQFEEKVLPQIVRDFSSIAGQKPQLRRARKSIAGFKTREGQIIGLKVTLRKGKMVDFWTRLVTIVLPRVKDFNGIDPKDVDQGGTLNTGFKEQFVFPEINPEESLHVFSLGVNAVPRRKDRTAALQNLKELGLPFKKDKPAAKHK
jgi:large subunit ribosomal protein L5